MNFEFVIVFTSNGLVFATLLYLVMTCEMPDSGGSAKFRIWAKIDGILAERRRESTPDCIPSSVARSSGALMMLECHEQKISSLGPPVKRP